jgi:hypothetical protein
VLVIFNNKEDIMKYQNDVSVIVEDDVIKVLGEDGIENTIIFLKSNSKSKSKVVDKRTVYSNSSVILKNESYIERLYEESLKEIHDMDRMIIREAFAKELYKSNIKRPSFISVLKRQFNKKNKK